jgi:hypothetical protein
MRVLRCAVLLVCVIHCQKPSTTTRASSWSCGQIRKLSSWRLCQVDDVGKPVLSFCNVFLILMHTGVAQRAGM